MRKNPPKANAKTADLLKNGRKTVNKINSPEIKMKKRTLKDTKECVTFLKSLKIER